MRKLLIFITISTACAHQAPVIHPGHTVGDTQSGTHTVKAGPPPRLFELPPAILYKESRELMAKGDWDGAQARIDAYLAREPKNAAALFDAGWLSEKRGDPKTAADRYRKALDVDAGHVGAAINLTRLYREQDRTADAENVLRSALAKRADDPGLLNGLAAVLRAEKRLDEADSLVKQVLTRHPADADAYRNLAAIEADRGHVRLAESALNNARKLDPKDAGILNSLGLLAMRRDDVTAGREYFAQATQLDPAFASAWANLGAIALRYRDYAAAEQDYAKAIALDANRWDTRLAHAWALEGLRKPKDARAEYEKVLALRPAQEDALYGRALALKAENELQAAMQAFKDYVASANATRVKEAQTQIAAIDLRLKNPPAPALKPAKAPAALDLNNLPQGEGGGPSTEKLPAEEENPVRTQDKVGSR